MIGSAPSVRSPSRPGAVSPASGAARPGSSSSAPKDVSLRFSSSPRSFCRLWPPTSPPGRARSGEPLPAARTVSSGRLASYSHIVCSLSPSIHICIYIYIYTYVYIYIHIYIYIYIGCALPSGPVHISYLAGLAGWPAWPALVWLVWLVDYICLSLSLDIYIYIDMYI